MVLESKHYHDHLAGGTVHLYDSGYASTMSSDTKVLESELRGNLHQHQCILLL